MPTEMTMRDHYAAAALTGLIASREWPIDSDEAAHYCYRVADAMLRERERTNHDAAPAARASLPTADHAVCWGRESGCGTGGTPAIDRLREWERHGSGRWGLGAAGDVTMLERRLAMVEAIVHDAAPEATARTDADRVRTDNAASRPGAGTGDTQEPVAWGVQDDRGLQYALHPTPGHASHMARTASVGLGEVVPLYRHRQPTLTDAEREAVDYFSVIHAVDGEPLCNHAATLRGLLERLGGGR